MYQLRLRPLNVFSNLFSTITNVCSHQFIIKIIDSDKGAPGGGSVAALAVVGETVDDGTVATSGGVGATAGKSVYATAACRGASSDCRSFLFFFHLRILLVSLYFHSVS